MAMYINNWDTLPSASSINSILKIWKDSPDICALYFNKNSDTTIYNQFAIKTRDIALGKDCEPQWWSLYDAISKYHKKGWEPPWLAVLTLVAYPEYEYMLESTVEELAVLEKLGSMQALMMLPMVRVINHLKNI